MKGKYRNLCQSLTFLKINSFRKSKDDAFAKMTQDVVNNIININNQPAEAENKVTEKIEMHQSTQLETKTTKSGSVGNDPPRRKRQPSKRELNIASAPLAPVENVPQRITTTLVVVGQEEAQSIQSQMSRLPCKLKNIIRSTLFINLINKLEVLIKHQHIYTRAEKLAPFLTCKVIISLKT